MEKRENISMSIIKRLPRYYRFLQSLKDNGMVRISSKELADRMGLTASQIRHDCKELKTILIGAGNLGKAVSNKIFIRQSGFKLIGIFDKNEAICGNMIKGIPVRHINYLENFCIDNQPVCAVICIPGSDMQEITDMLVRLGVRAFWNFSNYDIAMAHPEVLVENVHLNDSLMTLGYLTNTSMAEDEAR